jgi:hypothetical protein
LGLLDFVNCLFVSNANQVVVDDDVEEPNNACGLEILFKNIYEI